MSYVRDGKIYNGGPFGGELVEAVHGNSEAERYAREYQGGMIGGFATSMAGVLGLLGGAFVWGGQEHATAPGQTVPPTGPIVMGIGLAAYIAGLTLMFTAMPKLYDAINVYNDGIAAGANSALPSVPGVAPTPNPSVAPTPPPTPSTPPASNPPVGPSPSVPPTI
jgi:hypothetical protein